jgi:hypothetical protein
MKVPRIKFNAIAVILACVFGGQFVRADGVGLKWWWRNPLPGGAGLNGVAFGDDRFVAVGNGIIVTSTDGESWDQCGPLTTNKLNSVCFGGARWVAVGKYGTIFSSTDGIQWTALASPVTTELKRVAYGRGTFVAVGLQGTIITSQNGTDWSINSSVATGAFFDIAYGNGIFVAASDGAPAISNDGQKWSLASGNIYGYTVAFGNGIFLLEAASTAFTSIDGGAWNSLSANAVSATIRFCNGRFVGIGDIRSPTILASTDGLDWIGHRSDVWARFKDAAGGKGLCVVVGKRSQKVDTGFVVSTSDFETWAEIAPPIPSLTSVLFGQNRFVAFGSMGSPIQKVTVESPTGTNWSSPRPVTQDASELVIGDGVFMSHSVKGAYGNGLFIAVPPGSGGFLRSSDGINWTADTFADGRSFSAVGFFDGSFVAVGPDGQIAISATSTNWEYRDTGSTAALRGITHGNGTYVAVGSSFDANILVSSNLVSWESIRAVPVETLLYNVAFGGDTFVAVGYNGRIYESPDGRNWSVSESILTGFSPVIWDVCFGNGTFVALADDGIILQASPVSALLQRPRFLSSAFDRQPDGRVTLSIQTESTVTLEASSDLRDWMNISSSTNSGGIIQFVDQPSPALTSRFYRARAVP